MPVTFLACAFAAACAVPTEREYVSDQQHVRLSVPAGWTEAIEEGPDRGLRGPDGFVKLTAMAGSPTVEDACRADAFHKMQPYGPKPRVEPVVVDGQVGCRIVPSVTGERAKDIPAGLILEHPEPVMIEPRHVHRRPYPYLVVWVDPPHLAMVEKSLRFIRD